MGRATWMHRRGKPTLGIVFGDALYPHPLAPAKSPDLDEAPRLLADGDAIDRLLRCIIHFDIAIYPSEAAQGRAARIYGWLSGQFRLWFERHDVDEAPAHAAALLKCISVVDVVPNDRDREVTLPEEWPTLDELASLDAALGVLERVVRLALASAVGD